MEHRDLFRSPDCFEKVYQRQYNIEGEKTSNSHKYVLMITTSAILMALGAVLKLFGIMITSNMRISFFAIPLILAGLMNGFTFGVVTSIGADLAYSLFSGYAFNPAFTISAVYYGILGGILRLVIKKYGKLPLLVLIIGVLITSLLETHTNLLVTYLLYGKGATIYELFTKYLILIIKLPIITLIVKVLNDRLIQKYHLNS